jgi:hypothetical protein
MEKGIAPLIAFGLVVLISTIGIYLALNTIKPALDRAFESAVMNEADQNMQILDNLIKEVASEGIGSSRSFVLKVSDGNYKIVNTSGDFTGAIQFKIGLKQSPFAAPMFKKVGNLKYSVGMTTAGLVGYWKFDEGNGTKVKDSSDHGNDGIVYNGSEICASPPISEAGCPEWVDGKFGRGLSFDGLDDYVNCSITESLNISYAITLEAWVKEQGYENNPYVLTKESGYSGWTIHIYSPNNMTYSYVYNGSAAATVGFGLIPLNEWHHLATVVNTNENYIRSYKDGASFEFVPWVGGFISSGPTNLRFGVNFNGSVDEVRVYNRALSEEEIKENHHVQASNYQIVLEYEGIILTGNLRVGRGEHKICIEKIGELNNKPLVKITTC